MVVGARAAENMGINDIVIRHGRYPAAGFQLRTAFRYGQFLQAHIFRNVGKQGVVILIADFPEHFLLLRLCC